MNSVCSGAVVRQKLTEGDHRVKLRSQIKNQVENFNYLSSVMYRNGENVMKVNVTERSVGNVNCLIKIRHSR